MWSEYLVQTPFNLRERNSEQIRDMLQALIEASLQGDSGLAISSSDVAQLGKFAVHASQAAQTVAPMVYDDEMLALYRYWSLEQRLATQVHRLTQMQLSAVDVTSYTNLLTDPHQQAAMKMVANHALNIITGGPGTGKTYTLARIIAVLNQAIPDIRIAMAAPTGKAAQRMQEALQASFQDTKLLESGLLSEELQQQSTQTLHRLLGLGHQQRPRYHAKQPLPYDVVVVDEASMLDLQLATLLFEAIPANCRLILLGDAKQLASVDVGAVLADLQQVPALKHNHVQLVTSRRFNAEAKIGQFAGFIQHLSD
ncbi:AAA family ATPase, partial [uncultured Acinetobacter sp.]